MIKFKRVNFVVTEEKKLAQNQRILIEVRYSVLENSEKVFLKFVDFERTVKAMD